MNDKHLRDMRRSDWRRILKRRYAARPSDLFGPGGVESLLLIDEIASPLTVGSGPRQVKIVEEGYAWLQIAPAREHFWLTAMFDGEDRLLQIYFDITGGSRFDDPDNPTFEDRYLDVVLLPDGQFFVLDEDELDAALRGGALTRAEYDDARRACDGLCARLSRDANGLMASCCRAERALKALPIFSGR